MNPLMKYTMFRLALFLLIAVPLWVLPIPLDPIVKLMVALLVSAVVSLFVQRRMRDDVSSQVATTVQKRSEKKERLRAALAGDDDEQY